MKPYIAGMIDGDGTILLIIRKRSKATLSYQALPQVELRVYFAGLLDSDGCIHLHVFRDRKRMNAVPRISWDLKEANQLKTIFNRLAKQEGFRLSINQRQDRLRFVVSGVQNVKKFLNSIQPYLVLKRQQADIMLKKILPFMERKKHLTKEGFLQLMEYADELASLHFSQGRRKYNKSFFEKLWSSSIKREFNRRAEAYFFALKERRKGKSLKEIQQLIRRNFQEYVGITTLSYWVRGLRKPVSLKTHYHEKAKQDEKIDILAVGRK